MQPRGAIIVLAYPDLFVKATDGSYNYILRKVGIVNADLVRAGHAAALLIEEDGTIHYTDFGRYITPGDSGRTRTSLTDPEVRIRMRAEFSSIGTISNLSDILVYIENNPEITHSYGQLFSGIFYNANVRSSLDYARDMSLRGSMSYGPFVYPGSNCARYVWSLLWKGLGNGMRLRLMSRFWPSPMPLDLVMCAEVYSRFLVESGDLRPFSKSRWPIWRRLLEKPGSEHLLHIDKSQLYEGKGTWLGDGADGAWFEISESAEDAIRITRRNERGAVVFSHWYSRPLGFEARKHHEFVFDSNASFCHLRQNGVIHRVEKIHGIRQTTMASATASGKPGT